jgi:hypothetical protein
MARALDREKLLEAFDAIGRAAVEAQTRLEVAVYGGSALMLASNFRFATEDVDVSPLEQPLPSWLRTTVDEIAHTNDWAEDWFNDGVTFHLSQRAEKAADHLEFGTFPRAGAADPGLIVYVPQARYMLALKLKAMRINDPIRGDQERRDVLNLMRVLGIDTIESAIDILARYFPNSAASPERQKFLLKNMSREGATDAPAYPRRGD